jgi:hypothetical protein
MNNDALEAYGRQAERVARLLAWLHTSVERHYERAADFSEEAFRLWPMVGTLAHLEELLKSPVCYISGMSDEDIADALGDGRAGK